MNVYQFRKISSIMAKKFGKMDKGDEGIYAPLLYPMEGNVVKIHRAHPATNDFSLQEGLHIVLHKVDGYLKGEEVDVKDFMNKENMLYANALSYAFDPFYNSQVMELINNSFTVECPKSPYSHSEEETDFLIKFFAIPIQCLLRIEDTIKKMSNHGINGYFDFMDFFLGDKIQHDSQMNFSMLFAKNYRDDEKMKKIDKDKFTVIE